MFPNFKNKVFAIKGLQNFSFVFENNHLHNGIPVEKIFSVLPERGVLVANDKPTNVNLI